MDCSAQEASAGSSWTIPEDEGRKEETVATPAILISNSSYTTTAVSMVMHEPGLSSRRGIHKTIRLPPPPSTTADEMPLSTAALMKRMHELDQENMPITPVEKLIRCNPSAPPPAPINKKTRVRHPTKPVGVGCNNELYAFSPSNSNSGDFGPRSPLAPYSMNTGPLASPIHLVDANCVDCLPSPVSEKTVGSLDANADFTVATD